jgi:type IV secretion system protein VirB9
VKINPALLNVIAAVLAVLAVPASAEIVPIPGEGDPHIQTVAYDPLQVVALRVASGYAVTVRFSPDERIETVSVGDPGSWQVQANRRADNLVIKPVGPALPTNLTVITDQRSYSFALYSAITAGDMQPFIVTFTYPMQPVPPGEAKVTEEGRYHLRGEMQLRPAFLTDDGAFTSMKWPAGAAMPAVYSQDAKGNLALVNGAMRDGGYVIEGVHDRLVFVLGKARASATRIGADRAR